MIDQEVRELVSRTPERRQKTFLGTHNGRTEERPKDSLKLFQLYLWIHIRGFAYDTEQLLRV